MVIYAKSGNHALLFNGKIKVIGSVMDCNRFNIQGQLFCCQKVILNYGTEFTDTFYFENNKLVYSVVSFQVEDYISETYQSLIKKGTVSLNDYLDGLLGVYVFKEMGVLLTIKIKII